MMTTAPLRLATIRPEAAWAPRPEARVRPASRPWHVVAPAVPPHQPSVGSAAERAIDREYLCRGGLARGDELLNLVRARCEQPISRVARWIVGRELLQYRSGLDAAFPLFQFDGSDMSIRPVVRRVIGELASVLDDVELAQWFVRPNVSLNGAMPIDALERDAEAVIDTARTDRFIARG